MESRVNYSYVQAREIGFDRNAYTPAAEGVFMGRLVMKIYGDFCLRCYFQTADKQKLKVTAYQNRRTGRYSPRRSEVNFETVPLQTIWGIRVERNKRDRLTWVAATQLSGGV